jgi:hypothetical protein
MRRRWLWPLVALIAAAVVLLWTREDPVQPPVRAAGPPVPRPADQGTIGPAPTPAPPAMSR